MVFTGLPPDGRKKGTKLDSARSGMHCERAMTTAQTRISSLRPVRAAGVSALIIVVIAILPF
jgi:hypothetical protein